MKGCVKKIIIVFLCVLLSGCSVKTNATQNSTSNILKAGAVVGKYDDTWRTSVRNQLYEMAEENGVDLCIWNAEDSQETENKKIDELINNRVDVLIVNLVEVASAGGIIAKAKEADIPVVFFNIQPSEEDMNLWDKVYYVGAKAEKSGTLEGQILVDYFHDNPADDGVIDYVMLKGPEEHQDTILRTKYSVKVMDDADLSINELAADAANWDRELAKEKMDKVISEYQDKIDCVIANNDDMALGAIDALKSNGYFNHDKYIPVVGVDATSSAIGAVKSGLLLGTVLNDAINQGKAIFNVANVLAQKKEPNRDNCGFEISDGKYIWVDYQMITIENADNAN